MFEERNVIYFDPFYFKNGNTAKPKYFVVLKQSQNQSVIASLPTRKNTIPYNEDIESGCLELPDINLSCFVIPQSIEITECGKSFTSRTYMYGHQIDDYEIALLQEIYQNEGSDYEIWGKMKLEIFNALINCFKSSKSVKRKYKNLL
ncbi:MAG: hypothetical protein EPN39_16010 [Chitinophagaceae bacterium]|jgi:hypothetical protein|nr:MAG: hypothetical protein EPN39_16010 [Chitinophagaceae bacterium]